MHMPALPGDSIGRGILKVVIPVEALPDSSQAVKLVSDVQFSYVALSVTTGWRQLQRYTWVCIGPP